MRVLEWVIIGCIWLCMMGWQSLLLFEHDNWSEFFEGWDFENLPRRIHAPLVVGTVVLLGKVAWAVLRLNDATAAFAGFDLVRVIAGSLAFALVINLKAVFGPVYLAVALSTTAYSLFEHGTLESCHFMGEVINLLVEGTCPPWAQYLYGGGMCVYAVVSSTYESLIHRIHDFTH